MAMGSVANDPLRLLMAADSSAVARTAFKVYMVRTATIQERGGKRELGWKPVSTFAEMATPGTVFKGHWRVREFSRRREQAGPERVFRAANEHAAELISVQRNYAESAGLPRLRASLDTLVARLDESGNGPTHAC